MTGELLKMEVPRDIAVYGGRMLAVIFFSPWRGRVCMCMCAHGTGRAAGRTRNSYLLCLCISRGKDDATHAGYAAELGWC